MIRNSNLIPALLVLLCVLPLAGCQKKKEKKKKTVIRTNVELWEVETSSMKETVILPGTIESVNSASVSAEVPGTVATILVNEGDEVEKGRVLLKTDTTDLELGMRRAAAQLEAARAALDLANTQEASSRALWESGDLADEAYDAVKTQLTAAASQVKLAQVGLDNAKRSLDKAVVKAPISGIVTGRFVEEGELLGPGARLFQIDTAKKVKMVLWLPERVATRIGDRNRTVSVIVDAMDLTFDAEITYLAFAADQASRTFKCEIAFDNPKLEPQKPGSPRKFRIGLIAKAAITLREYPETVEIPIEALVLQGMRQVVYVVEDVEEITEKNEEGKSVTLTAGKARVRDVETGLTTRNSVQIKSGLEVGEKLVVKGQRFLRDDDDVRILPSEE